MIIDKNGSFRTQRQLPKMALIKPSIEGNFIVLNAPNKETIKVPVEPTTKNKIKCR